MPMNYKYDPEKVSEETKKIFLCGGMLYNPFQALCNWLYATKFSYGDRKRDSIFEDNVIEMKEEHIDQIIEAKLFQAVNPEEYDEESLRSMLKEFIGLKVWGT